MITLDEAKELAAEVLSGKSRSNVEAARILSDFVMGLLSVRVRLPVNLLKSREEVPAFVKALLNHPHNVGWNENHLEITGVRPIHHYRITELLKPHRPTIEAVLGAPLLILFSEGVTTV